MLIKQVKVFAPPRPWWKIPLRVLSTLVVAAVIAMVMHRCLIKLERIGSGPAGFGRGMAHGALMPMSLPNLLVGDDVPIYAANNTGRNYKLGYTVGVNGCGAIFFGFFFWRVKRWQNK